MPRTRIEHGATGGALLAALALTACGVGTGPEGVTARSDVGVARAQLPRSIAPGDVGVLQQAPGVGDAGAPYALMTHGGRGGGSFFVGTSGRPAGWGGAGSHHGGMRPGQHGGGAYQGGGAPGPHGGGTYHGGGRPGRCMPARASSRAGRTGRWCGCWARSAGTCC
ncbi:MAG: hypothetical protein VKS61_11720, partial [Candidatus Sericytochromatia bacterium]|nr:hypothetical protein [Candidatus Sericytochromatia bacterium]